MTRQPLLTGLRTLALALMAGALAPAFLPAAHAQAPQAPQAAVPLEVADLSAWLDGRVPYALKSGDIAGAVISVVKDGKVLLQKGYGYADVAAKKPMDPATTMVRPGSTSKLFTWTAVMQLVQQGKLDLDRDVNDYLDFKIEQPHGKPVTLRDLMNHRAGFEEGLKDLLAYDPQRAPTTERYLKDHPRPQLFTPGTVPGYSNYGVALAGYIVQRVSGEPFERYVERHLFQPLGMLHTSMEQPLPEKFRPFAAQGYRTASDKTPSPFELVVTAPAGSGSSTAADMARFMLAHLQQGRLDGFEMLDAATTARMHSPTQKDALPGYGVMAHGFFSAQQNGHWVIGHGGDTVVFHTELDLLPKEGVGIFFTFNSRGKDGAVYGARKELFDGFMDRYFPGPAVIDPPALPTAAADAQRIAGRYQTSRRVENGFLSALYLMNQTVITANPDGTINAPDGPLGGEAKFREVAPQRWRKLGSTQELALVDVDGVPTVIDSENPVSVLQQASVLRSAPLTLTVLGLSCVVLLGSLLAWPLGALLRRADRAASGASAEQRRLRRWQRIAAAVAVVYLGAWIVWIVPVLSTELGNYSTAMDGVVRTLQVGGLAAIAAMLAGLWAAWRLLRLDASRLAKLWAVLMALALVGVVWVAAIGQLLSWNLNY